jgi:hypothetical protein
VLLPVAARVISRVALPPTAKAAQEVEKLNDLLSLTLGGTMKELSKISKDEYGYHFECEWSGAGKTEMELVEAREKCGVRSVDVNWTLGQCERQFMAVVNGANLAQLTKVRDYLAVNGWPMQQPA